MSRARLPQGLSAGEEAFAQHCRAYGLAPEREYRFHSERKWRFDFAFPDKKIGVEIEGGTWTSGRHSRGTGYEKDLCKYNAAVREGWKVLRFSTRMATSGEAIEEVSATLREAGL
jgi:very-short-patch-repair endonuclease